MTRANETAAYHHGDLPSALLTAVDELVRERDPAGVTLREVARRVGVSHAAPAHHFGDKAGLLTAYAVQGLRGLRDELAAARADAGSPGRAMIEIGLAYVRFATRKPGHFSVMFRPELLERDDAAYRQARESAFEVLIEAVRALRTDLSPDDPQVRYAAAGAWSIVHGFADLWLDSDIAELLPNATPEQAAAGALTAFGATIFVAAGVPLDQLPDPPVDVSALA